MPSKGWPKMLGICGAVLKAETAFLLSTRGKFPKVSVNQGVGGVALASFLEDLRQEDVRSGEKEETTVLGRSEIINLLVGLRRSHQYVLGERGWPASLDVTGETGFVFQNLVRKVLPSDDLPESARNAK